MCVHTPAIIGPFWVLVCPMFRQYALDERCCMLWVVCIGNQLLIPSL